MQEFPFDENHFYDMENLQKRYSWEKQLLKAVSQGLTEKAEHIISNVSFANLQQRTKDPIRNIKNYCIILNTLLRKATEEGFVHPYYIDKLSSSYAIKIESCTSMDQCLRLQKEMVRKYSLLVKNHSMQSYSLLVQQLITRIDSDLTADLTLKTLAATLNVNPSYLSNLFKKETSYTLTDYVNRKRIEHAIFLLNSTSLQIQEIALHCGIPDMNYFSKLFKKYIQLTPTEYRKKIRYSP